MTSWELSNKKWDALNLADVAWGDGYDRYTPTSFPAKLIYGEPTTTYTNPATATASTSNTTTSKPKERIVNMKVYHVKFDGTEKLYAYYSKVPLVVGAKYSIVADETTEYKNNITVVKIDNAIPINVKVRTITSAKQVQGAPRPNDRIKRVVFNEEKLTTVVIWWDGQKTIVKCQEGDVFDKEKALAMCYMKRVLGNRGSFNEVLKKYCHAEE